MPRARWHIKSERKTGFVMRAVLDENAPITCVSPEVELRFGAGYVATLEMPFGGVSRMSHTGTPDDTSQYQRTVNFAKWVQDAINSHVADLLVFVEQVRDTMRE